MRCIQLFVVVQCVHNHLRLVRWQHACSGRESSCHNGTGDARTDFFCSPNPHDHVRTSARLALDVVRNLANLIYRHLMFPFTRGQKQQHVFRAFNVVVVQ